MQARSEQLRQAIEKQRSAARSGRWRCAPSLRQEVVAHARFLRECGESVGSVASELGVSESALSRWLGEAQGQSGFREAKVIADSAVKDEGGGLVLVTPGGYRVEGLELRSIAALLRELQ
jgi:hypothetical protein